MDLLEMINDLQEKGYDYENASARICQDIVLKAISKSSLAQNVTIKGGVVMRSITNNIRRATLDIDIDFIRYSLLDESIDRFITKLNCIEGISIKRVGKIEELNQQEYNGKRVYVLIADKKGNTIKSKIDLGVHKHLEIKQQEFCFDISFDNDGAYLLINSKEQMFTEKLRSLLKFGIFSTRYKDIFDIYYQCDKLDERELLKCIDTYIYKDSEMRENNKKDILSRIENIFNNETFKSNVDKSDKRWIDDDIDLIFSKIKQFIESAKI